MKRISVIVLCSFFCFGFASKEVSAIETEKLCQNWNAELLETYDKLDEGYKNRRDSSSKVNDRMNRLQDFVKQFCNVDVKQYMESCGTWHRNLMLSNKLTNKTFANIVTMDIKNRILLHCQKSKE
jgi:hypothetical protein